MLTRRSKILNGCWNSCHSPCPLTGQSFVADAIISNPPAFAHIHCAEALGIPLLASFSMFPSEVKYILSILENHVVSLLLTSYAMVCWIHIHIHRFFIQWLFRSPTILFPHPLVNVTTSNIGSSLNNCLSYAAAEILQWKGYEIILSL